MGFLMDSHTLAGKDNVLEEDFFGAGLHSTVTWEQGWRSLQSCPDRTALLYITKSSAKNLQTSAKLR